LHRWSIWIDPVHRSALLCLLTLCVSAVQADERILLYHSDIRVHEDATMTVTETIRVAAEGKQIQRGIYRDFPTEYEDTFGNSYRVAFEVLAVARNHQPEPWHTDTLSNGVRVYAGSANQRLKPGIHTYEITYRTDRQIGYFDTHDELYWNVNGNGWAFAIEQVSATLSLPAQIPLDAVSLEGYTGGYGSRDGDYRTGFDGNGLVISTTRELAPGEGLTLVASWPKGSVYEPSQLQRLIWLLRDNIGLLLALLALIGSAVYLYRVWARFGKDPQPGPIFAHYEPPAGYSPASTRYIHRLGYDNGAFSAAIVNLAVHGHLEINNNGDTYTLSRSNNDSLARPAAAGEAALLERLFRNRSAVTLENENHRLIAAARRAHKKALHRDYANTYFLHNTVKIWPSCTATVLTMVLVASIQAFSLAAAALLILNAVMHGVYIYLLKAPTDKGRRLMDKLEGFKLYLEVAEKDDLNLKHPPDMTPQLFERYLPFAIALGVEQAWADQFTAIFAGIADQQGSPYQPHWYHGRFNHHAPGQFARSVGSEFSSVVAAAATPPGSSSGSGGGGFSGGGGGGGGGGGW